MAQKKNDNEEFTAIPAKISWNDSSKEPKYRGATMIANNSLQQGGIAFKGSGFAKNASSSQTDAFSIPADISGGAIDISFGSGSNKSSYPSIQPVNFGKSKGAAPIIDVQVIPDQDTKKNVSDVDAPLYDGFQPHNAHRSNSMNPIKMQQTVQTILTSLVASGNIDFYQTQPFVFAGRAFAEHSDCEFLLNIFSDDVCESVVEIRRSSGECFEYGNVESSILKQLISNGAIIDKKGNESDSEMEEDSSLNSFTFGLGPLPPLDSLELDSDIDSNDDFKNDALMNKETAIQIVEDAVDLDAMRDILRSNIIYLNESMAKHEDIFKSVPDIISVIVKAASGNIFDCWTIKMYLGMVSQLISCSAAIPSSLLSSIKSIQTKWSNVVRNEVGLGCIFEFFPSQQIVRNCQQIIEQLE